MGIAKKVGIIVMIYLLVGLVWSVLRWQSIIPIEPGGLEGPLNILYLVFEPVSFIFFMLLMALGLF